MKVWSVRWSCRAAGILVAAVIGLTAMRGETVENRPTSARQTNVKDSQEENGHRRIREGAKLEAELGEFREWGERIRFHLHDDKTSFVAVENLALDRVSRVLDASTSPRTWSVSGVVTEYRGGNYLLVTRAALKAQVKRSKATPRK